MPEPPSKSKRTRLLVCSRDTVFYKTAHHLTRTLAPLRKTADSFISDSTDFYSKLKNITDPDQIISYDVVDLFTNVPIDDTLQILRHRMTETPLETSLSTESNIALTLPPVSLLPTPPGATSTINRYTAYPWDPHSLTEIYMTHFEQQAFTTSPFQPICWYRKVDDTFVILKQDQDPTLLLQHLNQQHPRVQFTIEIEKDNQLPVLDVLVCRNSANRIQTSVYRKPTHTDQYIHFNPTHLLRTKTGIMSTLTKRAINFSSANLKPEIEHLRQIFTHLNNYPPNLVDKVITSHANIDTHFTSSNSLKILLRANGRNTTKPQEPKGVVYKIDCNCGQSYTGKTSRPINTRMKEHKTSTIKSDSKSAIPHHISKCPNHNINFDDVKILSNNLHDFTKRKLTEAVHIRLHKPSINRDQGYFIPFAYYELIKQ
ncbi:uncharacterized protein [Haliotis cracherodii]|uniref:uncharacterized protein n=1 Tax=Haliotis cracherodii TaxID=6455 RepID=UPI0039E79B22